MFLDFFAIPVGKAFNYFTLGSEHINYLKLESELIKSGDVGSLLLLLVVSHASPICNNSLVNGDF